MTRCPFCSLGCRAGLRLIGPDQYGPVYVAGGDYSGLCARGSMLGELTNHRDRLLWPVVRTDSGCSGYKELSLRPAIQQVTESLRGAASGGQARVFIDGNADLASLASAAMAFQKMVGSDRAGIYVPQADAEMLAGCETSGADYTAPPAVGDADAILVVGNAFATHPVIAHWGIEQAPSRRPRPLMVLDARSGVTSQYATSPMVVAPGTEHLALALLAGQLGVADCRCESTGINTDTISQWADSLKNAEKPVVLVAAEFGRAARWFEIGRLAGQIARASGGKLLPLTVYGNALGAVRLAEKLGLADFDSLCRSAASVTLALGTGMAERIGSGGRVLSAASLRPEEDSPSEIVVPLAWPFEVAGPVLLPGDNVVARQAAVRPPAGVPTLGELASQVAGLQEQADPGDLPPARKAAARKPDLTPLSAAGEEGENSVVVLGGDPINFADGAITRRVSFAREVLPLPILAVSTADAQSLGVTDGHRVCVKADTSAVIVVAQVAVEEGQALGQAVLSGAYAEARQLTAPASADGQPTPIRVTVEAKT